MSVSIKKANQHDFEIIANLAKYIWNHHYVPIIGIEQVNYMLEKIYSKESLLEQISLKKHDFYLVVLNDLPVGFISISFENITDLWIHKFYISQDYQGKGFGEKVFYEIIKKINEPKQIRLTVNRQNYKSINFYFKLGFKIEKVADFDIGNGYFMNDFVMLKK
jgi:RimJ/RimL family protein N-acetyltransferase